MWTPSTFQFLRLFKNAKSNGCCEIDTHREWIWQVNIQKLSFLAFMYCSMAPDKRQVYSGGEGWGVRGGG